MYIAILEDEVTLAEEVKACLEQNGHTVKIFGDGASMIKSVRRDTFDLFVLDWKVPKKNGFEVLKDLRNNLGLQEPVIFLTSTDTEASIVSALAAGADDYCIKPVRLNEFMARIAALERRTHKSIVVPQESISVAGFTFNSDVQTVTFNDTSIVLNEKEFKLSKFLFNNLDRALSRNRILMEIWGKNNDELSRTLDVHVAWIRRKLNLGANNPALRLTAIYGYGYRLMQVFSE
jgi:DNA-binding response OmpR family regulator